MNSERAFLNAQAVLAEASLKQASHLHDADSLQTRAKFRYVSAVSRQQKHMDRLRATSLNDILAQFGDTGQLLLDPDNPGRDQLYSASDVLNKPR